MRSTLCVRAAGLSTIWLMILGFAGSLTSRIVMPSWPFTPEGRDVADAAAHLNLKCVAPAVQVRVGDEADVVRLFFPGFGEHVVHAGVGVVAAAANGVWVI